MNETVSETLSKISHEDLAARLDAGNLRFKAVDEKLAGIATLLEPLPKMKEDLEATRDIVEAWNTAKNLARFVKWASGIAAGLLAIWALAKAMAKGLV